MSPEKGKGTRQQLGGRARDRLARPVGRNRCSARACWRRQGCARARPGAVRADASRARYGCVLVHGDPAGVGAVSAGAPSQARIGLGLR